MYVHMLFSFFSTMELLKRALSCVVSFPILFLTHEIYVTKKKTDQLIAYVNDI